jgi:UDP-glucose:(heptosyl)LPS alpha-1,3-glucosyltransferase
MKIALCYESVLPSRGGCEIYIADLARKLAADGHAVHLYASRWDENGLPAGLHYHYLPKPRGPRFLRPWRFAASCERALRASAYDVSLGFNKTWGQDVLYPQAGIHMAATEHNLLKYAPRWRRQLARVIKSLDMAYRSYSLLERKQYLGQSRPYIVVNSRMVRGHFERYYGIPAREIRVVHSAIDPDRFQEDDRPGRRLEFREKFGIRPDQVVGLFIAMNYRLKGLEPLLHSLHRIPDGKSFRLLVVGNTETHRYEGLVRRLGVADRVCFAGYHSDTRNCFFASDFLVHPTFYDPCSLVVLEALACGLPVITSRFNGASELLSPPHDGYVVADPHDDEHLGWCITQLLDPVRRVACSQSIRRKAGQWTFDHHYRLLMDVLREAATRRIAA